jgi:hypothetical protein
MAFSDSFSTSIVALWAALFLMFVMYDPLLITFYDHPITIMFFAALFVGFFALVNIGYHLYHVKHSTSGTKALTLFLFVFSAMAIVMQGYNYASMKNGTNFILFLLLHIFMAMYLTSIMNAVEVRTQVKKENTKQRRLTRNTQMEEETKQAREITRKMENLSRNLNKTRYEFKSAKYKKGHLIGSMQKEIQGVLGGFGGDDFAEGATAVKAEAFMSSNLLSTATYSLLYLLSMWIPGMSSVLEYTYPDSTPSDMFMSALTHYTGGGMFSTAISTMLFGGVLTSGVVGLSMWGLWGIAEKSMNSLFSVMFMRNVKDAIDNVTDPFIDEKLRREREAERKRQEAELDRLRIERERVRKEDIIKQNFHEGHSCRLLVGVLMLMVTGVFLFTETLNTNIMTVNGLFNLILMVLVLTIGYFIREYSDESCKEDSVCQFLVMLWVVCAAVYKSTSMLSRLAGVGGSKRQMPLMPFILFILQSGIIMFLYYSTCVSEQLPDDSVFTDFRLKGMDKMSEVTLQMFFVALMFVVFGSTILVYFLPIFSLL